MKISEILSRDSVFVDLKTNNKKQLLQELSAKAAEVAGVDERVAADSVWERENLGSTGYGNGAAFPHARIEGLDKVVATFARLAQPIDFNAVDGKPVDLVFLLISPENSGADHLTALAMVSRVLKNPDVCEKLRQAGSRDEILAILNS